jgi:hypothetical protein
MLEPIEHEAFADVTKDFPFPSDERKIIRGPDDLTREQAKLLGKRMKDAKDLDNDGFFEMVFTYWATLPGAEWNLARKGARIPLTAKSLVAEIGKNDFGALAIQVTKHLYPYMFEQPKDTEKPDEDDLMDGLTAEDGSDAAMPEDQDPNAETPESQ